MILLLEMNEKKKSLKQSFPAIHSAKLFGSPTSLVFAYGKVTQPNEGVGFHYFHSIDTGCQYFGCSAFCLLKTKYSDSVFCICLAKISQHNGTNDNI